MGSPGPSYTAMVDSTSNAVCSRKPQQQQELADITE